MKTKRIFTFFMLAFLIILSFVEKSTIKDSVRAAENSTASTSFGYTFALNKEIPLLAHNITYPHDAFFDEATNNLYYISFITSGQYSLVQVNLNTNSVTLLANFNGPGSSALSPNGRYLYFAEFFTTLTVHVFDTISKQVIRTFDYESEWGDFIATDDNRLFILTSTSVDMIDGTTGGLIKSFPFLGGSSKFQNFSLSPDQNSLFMIANYRIFKFDISEGDLTEILHTDPIEDYRSISLSNDGSYLLLSPEYGEWVYRFDPETLTLIDTYVYRMEASNYTWDTAGSQNSSTFYGLWTDALQEIDIATNQVVREIKDASLYAQAVIPVNNNRVALLYADKIELLAPTSHGVALPSIMNSYCAAPYIDDFSNPSSGWPVAVSGSTTYRYLSGEYNILFTEANRWAAVSAGHTWQNSKLLRVEGRIANNAFGAYGFVYGLNNDWSNFYTFEVYPQYQGWAIFHYQSGIGWQLISNNTLSQINITGKNTLEIISTSPNVMHFYVNNVGVYLSEQRVGRVGLTGTSIASNVDIRYDNYVLVGENCPLPRQLSQSEDTLVSSYSVERPSLDTFLSDN